MVAAVQGPDRRLVAVHRTFLERRADGAWIKAGVRPAKMLLGPAAGAAVRLAPANSGAGAPTALAITEGIETGLSVAQALPGLAVWAAISASMMARLRLPEAVREIILCPDGDAAGRRAAERAAASLSADGRKVRIAAAPPGRDFNDLLQGAA